MGEMLPDSQAPVFCLRRPSSSGLTPGGPTGLKAPTMRGQRRQTELPLLVPIPRGSKRFWKAEFRRAGQWETSVETVHKGLVGRYNMVREASKVQNQLNRPTDGLAEGLLSGSYHEIPSPSCREEKRKAACPNPPGGET
jgi:hypothetical protein